MTIIVDKFSYHGICENQRLAKLSSRPGGAARRVTVASVTVRFAGWTTPPASTPPMFQYVPRLSFWDLSTFLCHISEYRVLIILEMYIVFSTIKSCGDTLAWRRVGSLGPGSRQAVAMERPSHCLPGPVVCSIVMATDHLQYVTKLVVPPQMYVNKGQNLGV
jgi:hypothetical protein